MLDDEHDELPLVSVGSGNYNLVSTYKKIRTLEKK